MFSHYLSKFWRQIFKLLLRTGRARKKTARGLSTKLEFFWASELQEMKTLKTPSLPPSLSPLTIYLVPMKCWKNCAGRTCVDSLNTPQNFIHWVIVSLGHPVASGSFQYFWSLNIFSSSSDSNNHIKTPSLMEDLVRIRLVHSLYNQKGRYSLLSCSSKETLHI